MPPTRPGSATGKKVSLTGAWTRRPARHRPIRATVTLIVEAVAETRCRLTISVDFEGHGIGKLLVPFLVRREAHKEMQTAQRREAGCSLSIARRAMNSGRQPCRTG